MYSVSQDWESGRFTYSDKEKDKLLSDLTDWLVENELFHSDYLDSNLDKTYRTY